MKIFELKLPNGELVALRRTASDLAVCPICGFIGGQDTAWIPTDDGSPIPSQDICPSCSVQFGMDDMIANSDPIGTQTANWLRLRLNWLDTNRWDDKALRQLVNIGILPEEIKKLRKNLAS
jgi:hypothetical protein